MHTSTSSLLWTLLLSVTQSQAHTNTPNPNQAILSPHESSPPILHDQFNTPDPLPYSTRAHWMRTANSALHSLSPCPFMAFGTAIVNHTAALSSPALSTDLGDLICTGLNHNNHTANPTLDGEISALQNCSTILTDPAGPYKLSALEALAAYQTFSLYTNGEPCPMCASAIAWTGFRECVFGTSIPRLVEWGWPQIEIRTEEVFARAWRLPRRVRLFAGVLAEETDKWFAWQWRREGACPGGCERAGEEGRCLPVAEGGD